MPRQITDQLLETIPNAKMTLEEGKKRFLVYCKARNLRPRTVENYIQGIDRFLQYMTNYHPRAIYCGGVERQDVEMYVIYLKHTANMTDTSINTYVRNLRAYLYYLMHEEEAIMPFKVRIGKADRQVKETYTNTELRLLTHRPSMHNISFSDYRNWVIVNFLIATGVRAQTLIEVLVNDLDFEGGYITLRYTKSGKSYRIPMDYNLKLILIEYLELTEGNEIEPLFITEDRRPLTYDGLKSAIERYNEKRGVKKKGLHLFRHTFAKMCVMNGMDVFALQKMLGHADLTTSRNYVEMFSEDLKEKFNDFSPLGNLLNNKPEPVIVPRRKRKIDMSKLK